MAGPFFWIAILMLAYIYAGYPALVFLVSLLFKRRLAPHLHEPRISVVIAAYNEEQHIRTTIENKLAQDYPRNLLEIIVVSDGSEDHTDAIAKEYQEKNVHLIRQEPRQGKTAALNLALKEATGDIIIFSDANSIFQADTLRNLVKYFSNPRVGYVTGKMIYVDETGSVIGDGCSTYMKYENWLRGLETRIGSVVGVDGGVDAIRKSLYQPMNPDQLPDFVLPLKVIEQGFRVIYAPEAILQEEALNSSEKEYRMRVRVSLRAFWALKDMKHLLNPFRYGVFAWQLLSHKLLRYTAFIPLIVAFCANILLLTKGRFYVAFFIVQCFLYLCAIAGSFETGGFLKRIFYICWYFVLINVAAFHAFVKFLKGEKQVIWNPRLG